MAENTDPFASFTVVTPETGRKAIDVPQSITDLVARVITEKSLDVVSESWDEATVKRFFQYIVGAADAAGVNIRKMETKRADGKKAIRLTRIGKDAEKASAEGTTADAPAEAPAEKAEKKK